MKRRVFIIGAGFSKPAGIPLANAFLPLLLDKLELEEMRSWLEGLNRRIKWLTFEDTEDGLGRLNIEEVFHLANFDIEVHRLKQHLEKVGRGDGCGTAWQAAESIEAWLSYLLRVFRDVLFEEDSKADLTPIVRWAKNVTEADAVVSFNYDTLVERSLDHVGLAWNHATSVGLRGVPVHKMHGSIDWIVADRAYNISEAELIFDKENLNRNDRRTGSVEDDHRLWRWKAREKLQEWVEGRELQFVPNGARPIEIGMAGFGAYKQVHQVPGLGLVWTSGMRALYAADIAIVVGFSLSHFDTMARLQFAEVARARSTAGRPLNVVVIDPFVSESMAARFMRLFRDVRLVSSRHEQFDWTTVV